MYQINYNYVISYNISVNDGIANGVEVKLIHVDRNPQLDLDVACTLWVIPLHAQVLGTEARLRSQNVPRQVLEYPAAFPITPITQHFYYLTFLVSRTQFPLLPAYATTTYKCQGRSMQRVIVHAQYFQQSPDSGNQELTSMPADHLYVACSRVTRGADLFIYPELPIIHQSIRRRLLTEVLNRTIHYELVIPQPQISNSYYIIGFHNGQGCCNKLNHYSSDKTFFGQLDILCLMELHSPLNGRFLDILLRNLELPGLERNGTGICMFMKPHIICEHLFSLRIVDGNAIIEIQSILLDRNFICFIYCNPHTSANFLRTQINRIMSSIPLEEITNIYFFGDFNRSCNSENVNLLFSQHGLLLQQPTIATHRSGSILDAALSNRYVQLHVHPSYWSDHDVIWCYVPRN